MRPAGNHAGVSGGAGEGGSSPEARHRRICRLQLGYKLIWRTGENLDSALASEFYYNGLTMSNLQSSSRAKEFKSAVNLLQMVLVHTGIYVVESICWETVYINSTLYATNITNEY